MRSVPRTSKLPTERDWQRAVVLEPRPAPRQPEFISDGGGLPFAPSALARGPQQLDPDDPAVAALVAQLAKGTTAKGASRLPWKRGAPAATPPPKLDGWRELARSGDEALFGRGLPPRLLTVAVGRDDRGSSWTCVAVSAARPLRRTRDGIRASGWRIDPTRGPEPGDSVLRVLATEQTFSGGQRADSRLLAPDLYVDAEELVLTMFVSPAPGFRARTPNPETPACIKLPHELGARRLVDGALYEAPS